MNVYLCVTLYHVYITMLMIFALGNDKKRNIVFLNANNDSVYKQYKYIYSKLIEKGYICDIRLNKGKMALFGIEKKNNYRQLRIVYKYLEKINENEFVFYNFAWNNSYIYPSASMLYKKCNSAIFVEESVLIANLKQEKLWKKMIHKYMGNCVDFYKDNKLKSILVQKPETFPDFWQDKLKKLNIQAMIEALSLNEKEEILEIISHQGKDLSSMISEPGTGIVYTSPFSEQKIISENEKINQIIEICNFYKQYGKVVLKLHPRDLSRYPVDKEIKVIPGNFPSELLSLTGYKFKFAVSVCSSAVNTTNAEYKVNMNECFYNKPEFILLDINGKSVK